MGKKKKGGSFLLAPINKSPGGGGRDWVSAGVPIGNVRRRGTSNYAAPQKKYSGWWTD